MKSFTHKDYKRLQKFSYLHLLTGCFMKISLQSSEQNLRWDEHVFLLLYNIVQKTKTSTSINLTKHETTYCLWEILPLNVLWRDILTKDIPMYVSICIVMTQLLHKTTQNKHVSRCFALRHCYDVVYTAHDIVHILYIVQSNGKILTKLTVLYNKRNVMRFCSIGHCQCFKVIYNKIYCSKRPIT